MSDTAATATKAVPIWIDLSTADLEGAKSFYTQLFGWEPQDPGPKAGGYHLVKLDGKDVAGMGPIQGEGQPTAWAVYIGSPDADATSSDVEKAGGTVVAPAFDVLGQGRMAVYQDPSGAFISVWQPMAMAGAEIKGENGSFGWAELNARGIDKAIPFYEQVFGWTIKTSPFGDGMEYHEFQLDGESMAGGMEMNPMVPAEVPSYWLVYFSTDDVAGMTEKAKGLGANVMLETTDYPGGKFSILADPQGAAFGLMSH